MSTVLNWSRFENGDVAPSRAFEAFCSQLFERWVRREHSGQITSYTLHGAGGDGGVEAFATLEDGDVVGLQVKWFERNISAPEMNKIRESLNRAAATFPRLKRYIVALRQNLTNARNKGEKGGVNRWAEFVKDAGDAHRTVEIVRWDEAGVLAQLACPGNQEVKAAWFEGELTFSVLSGAWERTRRKLRTRYLPDMHAVGCVEATLAADLWTESWVLAARQAISEARRLLEDASNGLTYFAQLTEGQRSSAIEDSLTLARAEITDLAERAGALEKATRTGPGVATVPWPTTSATYELKQLLKQEKYAHSFQTAEMVMEAASAFANADASLRRIRDEVEGGSALRLFAGPAGCGKTHASAAAVNRAITAKAPAVMVLASGCDPTAGAARLVGDALDIPSTWSLRRMLDAMEGLATLTHLDTATQDQAGFSRLLLIIDGLEESAHADRWSDVLADLSTELAARPRIHLVATTRPEFLPQLDLPKGVEPTRVPEDSDTNLPDLLRTYAVEYEVILDEVPWLGWALRTPLEVRLLVEEFQGQFVTAADGACTNLLTLFQRKLKRVESEARARAGERAWSDGLDLLPFLLTIIAKAGGGDGVPDKEVVAAALQEDPEFSAERVRFAISILTEHGLIDAWRPRSTSLRESRPEYKLATRHLSDFVLAGELADGVLATIRKGKRPTYPAALRRRDRSSALFAAMLAEGGHFAMDVKWKSRTGDPFAAHADALALLAPRLAGSRTAEVAAWLTKETRLNRALLRRVVLPVARIPGHPLGPRVLDAALRALPLPEREPVWSVPEGLAGTGPWKDCSDQILDEVQLDPSIDMWDGMPLVAAWTLSSVVEARRARARAMLAVWGAKRLDQMVELVRHMAVVDDPQVVDDIVVAALGASIGADLPNESLLDLARLVDSLFFAEDATAWTPSVQVRVAARAIVERANLVFPGTIPDLLARATPPYAPRGPTWPPIDLEEARTADGHFGGKLVRYPAHPYVATHATRPFFGTVEHRTAYIRELPDHRLLTAIAQGKLVETPLLARARKRRAPREVARRGPEQKGQDNVFAYVRKKYLEEENGGGNTQPTISQLTDWARRIVAEQEQNAVATRPEYSSKLGEFIDHTEAFHGLSVTTDGLQNGMLAHLVRSWGWSEQLFSQPDRNAQARFVDNAIAERHGSGPDQGTRSAVAQFREKYIFAAVDRIAGELADRLPVWSSEANAWVRLNCLDGVGRGLPDPLPGIAMDNPEADAFPIWQPSGILPEQFSDQTDLAHRAELWLTQGALLDPRTFVTAKVGERPESAVLGLRHFRRAHQGCVDHLVTLRAFGVPSGDLALLKRDAQFVATELFDRGAWVEEDAYLSPAVACWAPWLTWSGEDQGYDSFDASTNVRRVVLRSAVGTGTSRFGGEPPTETSIWMPGPTLSRALGVVGIRGNRWSRLYVDREGSCVANERHKDATAFSIDQHYVLVNLMRYRDYLVAENMVPVWIVRIWVEAAAALFTRSRGRIQGRAGLNHHHREVVWLITDDELSGGLEVVKLKDELVRLNLG